MLSDPARLMRERALDALILPMHEALHPSFRWITRGAKVTRGYAVKLTGRDPILISYRLERDEAAATGLATRLIHDFGYDAIFKSAPNASAAYADFFDVVLRELGAAASVAIAGNLPFPLYLGIAEGMETKGWRVWRG